MERHTAAATTRPPRMLLLRPRLLVVAVAVFLSLLLQHPQHPHQNSVHASSTTSSSYESVRSLNSYGNAVQLQNAAAAADQQGRLIVALQLFHNNYAQRPLPSPSSSSEAISDDNGDDCDAGQQPLLRSQQPSSIWIASPVTPRPAHHRPHAADDSSSSRLLQAVTTTSAVCCYLVCTGVQADAAWLLQQLRTYGRNVAERYGGGGDSNDSSRNSQQLASLSTVASALKRRFWGYDNKQCWLPNGYAAMLMDDGEEKMPSWGRPLGIRSILIRSTENASSLHGDKSLVLELIEPSGIVTNIVDTLEFPCVCMGKCSDRMQKELVKVQEELLFLNEPNDEAVETLLLSAFAAALGTEEADSLQLQLEILSPCGTIERRIVTRKGGASL